jgi:hypothetical protein
MAKTKKGLNMTSTPILLISAIRRVRRWLRKGVYEDMARQALGWSQDELSSSNKSIPKRPIQLNFNIAKKNRLSWAKRRAEKLRH